MLEWADYAADIVDAMAEKDKDYRELLAGRDALREDYEAVLGSLTPAQRETVVSHEYYSVEMEYQKSRLAYALGKLRGGA